MLRNQRLVIALAVSLAAHAGAGLSGLTAWHVGGQQGSASSRSVTAVLLEDTPTVERPSPVAPMVEKPKGPAKAVEPSVAKAQRPPLPEQTELSAFAEATPTAAPARKANRQLLPNGATQSPSADTEKALPSAPIARVVSRLEEPSYEDHLEPTSVASAAAGSHAAAARSKKAPSGQEVEPYWTELAAWIERHKRYPRVARERRQQGVVQLSFVLDRQGRVLTKQVTRSSGYPTLDREATRILDRAAPLPAVPDRIADGDLSVSIPIDFRMP